MAEVEEPEFRAAVIGRNTEHSHSRDLKIAHSYRLPMPRFLFELTGPETTAASVEAMEFASLEDARQDALPTPKRRAISIEPYLAHRETS